ncbi:MAG: acyltransferase, partial [Desulfocapsaceae bacterium]
IKAEFDHPDIISVYYASGINNAGFREGYRKDSPQYSPHKKEIATIYLADNVARKIRIDTGTQPGSLKLYSVRLISYFGPDITFDHRQIYANFAPNADVAEFSLQHDHVLIRAGAHDPFLTLKGSLILENLLLHYGVPFILAALLFILLPQLNLRRLPAFADINGKTSSSGVNFDALDGIRGLAALLVLGQHTGVLRGSGIFGVWLFFCLSGFLLATPFVNNPARARSGAYMSHYMLRRIKRIVPMYFVMITITILFLGDIDRAIRHYLFLQADGHYWTIVQEMFFYLLLPPVMLVNALLFRNRAGRSILFFALCAYLADRYLTIELIPLYGDNATLRPIVSVFLTGVMMAYLYHWLGSQFGPNLLHPSVTRLASLSGFVLLVTAIAISADLIPGLAHINIWKQIFGFGLAGGAVIVLSMLAEGSFFAGLMKFTPLRAVGLVGYSFYLLHPMMISVVRATTKFFADYYPTGIELFIAAGIATYLISLFTYSYIERPFIMK